MNYGITQGHLLGYWKVILVHIRRWSHGRFQDDNKIFHKIKNDLTTGTWQDDIWCPINIILFCTSDLVQLLMCRQHWGCHAGIVTLALLPLLCQHHCCCHRCGAGVAAAVVQDYSPDESHQVRYSTNVLLCAPDQRQMLDVWGRHPADVNSRVKIRRFSISSSRNSQIRKILPDNNQDNDNSSHG
jgi:hypothetical protein